MAEPSIMKIELAIEITADIVENRRRLREACEDCQTILFGGDNSGRTHMVTICAKLET